jgi:hypothetical protein
MPRLLPDSITDNDLVKYLETSDFQLELDAFNALWTRGMSPAHGGTYTDPVSGKDRQFDLRASINHGICNLRLAIECKNLKPNFPLLISRVPRLADEAYHQVILGRQHSFPKDSGDIYEARGQIFRSREPVGKSATQVGKTAAEGKTRGPQIINSDSETYEKWSQAIASAHELIGSAGHSSIGTDSVNATVVFPLLVIPDHTLWAVDYGSDGSLIQRPREVDASSLYLGKKVIVRNIGYRISHLLIFTKSGFNNYLDKLRDYCSDEWEYLFPDNQKLVAYERSEKIV